MHQDNGVIYPKLKRNKLNFSEGNKTKPVSDSRNKKEWINHFEWTTLDL